MGDLLRPKYQVQHIVGETPKVVYGMVGPVMLATDPSSPDSPFVLMPRKDPSAFAAMLTYANCCEPQLAGEIRAWLRSIVEEHPLYGSQGERNWRYLKELMISPGTNEG